MSLIRCPECKQAVSDTISVCPHCGYKISPSEKETALQEAKRRPVTIESETKTIVVQKPAQPVVEDEGSAFGGFVLGFLFGIVGVILALCLGKKATKSAAFAGFVIQIVAAIAIGLVTILYFNVR